MKRLIRTGMLLAAFAMLAAACGDSGSTNTANPTTTAAQTTTTAASDSGGTTTAAPATTTAAPAQTGGEIVMSLATQPNALDVINSAERQAGNVAAQIFDALVWVNDEGTIEPALATSWDISADGSVYTFHLREGVEFSNGEPFNADVVVNTWKVGGTPENTYADIFQRASSVEAIDPMTVAITAAQPNALFMRQVGAAWPMFPPKYYAEVGLQEFSQKPIGTGPYMLEEWVQGDRIVLVKNPNYWRDGYPILDKITFRPITESSTRTAAIQTGEVDVANRLSPEEAASLDGASGVNVISYPKDRVYYIAFNNMTTGVGQPTMDKQVRQAMNYAVDVEGIIQALFAGNGRASTGYVTPADLGYDDSLTPYPYDPEKAKQLLSDAGFPDGFKMDMACPSGAYTNFEEVCQAVAAQLGDVGIDISLNIQESGAYWDLEGQKQLPPLFGDSWSETTGEAYNRLFGALGGDQASFSAWSDPKIDDMLSQILGETDEAARADLYKQLQQYMYDDPPFIYLYEPVAFEATTDRVANYKPRAAEEFFLWNTSVNG